MHRVRPPSILLFVHAQSPGPIPHPLCKGVGESRWKRSGVERPLLALLPGLEGPSIGQQKPGQGSNLDISHCNSLTCGLRSPRPACDAAGLELAVQDASRYWALFGGSLNIYSFLGLLTFMFHWPFRITRGTRAHKT